MVKDGRFREDLYYRLAVIPIRLPSLRERPEDIRLIAEHYLRQTAARLGKEIEGFDESALSWMEHHSWPGNVRELENVIERAVVLAHTSRITRADLGTEFTLYGTDSPFDRRWRSLRGNTSTACSKKCEATRSRPRRSSESPCGRSSVGSRSCSGAHGLSVLDDTLSPKRQVVMSAEGSRLGFCKPTGRKRSISHGVGCTAATPSRWSARCNVPPTYGRRGPLEAEP